MISPNAKSAKMGIVFWQPLNARSVMMATAWSAQNTTEDVENAETDFTGAQGHVFHA